MIDEWYSEESPKPSLYAAHNPGHFDFIEIGTSDYDTILQACASQQTAWWTSGLLPDNKDWIHLRGLCVDMRREFLKRLPSLHYVTKDCVAVADSDGSTMMHYVPLKAINRWERIFATHGSWEGYKAIQLAHGCSSLGKHRVLWTRLRKVGLQHLIRRRRVAVCTMPTLLRRHKVRSIHVFKSDIEVYDCKILQALLDYCIECPHLFPKHIIFETNGMCDELFGQAQKRPL